MKLKALLLATLVFTSPALADVAVVEVSPLTTWINSHTNTVGRVNAAALKAWVASNTENATITAAVPTSPLPTGPVAGPMTLTFREEFSTTLDPAKWGFNWLGAPNTITKPANSDEINNYDPAQVSVANGMLQLTAVARTATATDGISRNYASGLINTAGKFDWTKGIFEFRARIPHNWGAGWLNGYHGTWPDRGEIDIVERNSAVHLHYPGSGGADINKGFAAPAGWDYAQFHTYTAEWTTGKLQFWYDGTLVGTQTQYVLNYPNYMIFNNGVTTQHGEGFVTVPDTMYVDYFRVWQRP